MRESSLKLFSGLLSCTYHDSTEVGSSLNSSSKINLNIVNHDVSIFSPLSALKSISGNGQEDQSSKESSVYSHGLFSQGRHALELIKAKRTIQQIAEMEEVNTASTPVLSLARQLIVLMNSY